MCSTAASQFKTAGASSTKPGSASSSVTLSNNEVWSWYCARPKKTPDVEQLCSNNSKRTAILDQLRAGGQNPEARKALLEQLKLAPPPAYATTQALYTDFCKVAEHGEKPTCVRIKANQASTNMRNWYCASPAGSAGDWCKRQEILARMRADKVLCPLCNIHFGRRYLPKHMERHKIILECKKETSCATAASRSS